MMNGIKFFVLEIRRFGRNESGTTLVEFAICISLFLLILFGILDFARLGYHWVASEKAMQRAVRVASVRYPACDGVPDFHQRDDPTDPFYNSFRPGTFCRSAPGLCKQVNFSCTLAEAEKSANPLRVETVQNAAGTDGIWPAISPLLPDYVGKENILIRYEYDQRLGFLGGPYVPLVTAEIVGSYTPDLANPGEGTKTPIYFEFETPLSQLAGIAGSANAATILPDGTTCTACIPLPAISATIPGEDLNQGNGG